MIVFALFSMARFKLPHYVLPAYPPLLLLTGAFVDGARRDAVAAAAARGARGGGTVARRRYRILAWIRPAVVPDAPANTGVLAVLAWPSRWGRRGLAGSDRRRR